MTTDAKLALIKKALTPNGHPLEFSNDGERWVKRTLKAVYFHPENDRPFITFPSQDEKKGYSWKFCRESIPLPEMTKEQAEKKFGIIIV